MNTVSLINSYACLNILLALACTVFFLLKMRNSLRLEIQYYTLGIIFIFSLAQPLFPVQDFTNSTVRVWAAQSMNHIKVHASVVDAKPVISIARIGNTEVPAETNFALTVILLLISAYVFSKLMKEALLLRKIIKSSHLLRKSGKIYVLVNNQIQVPFSFWLPGRYYTVIPETLLTNINDFRVSLYHEFQHHRQGDTKFIHALIFLKSLCFLNPFTYLLVSHIHETQELACDETDP